MPVTGICSFCSNCTGVTDFNGEYLCSTCLEKAKRLVGTEIIKLAALYLAKHRKDVKDMTEQKKTSGGAD